MNFTELQEKLTNLTNRNISQSEIARSLDIGRSTVNIRTKTNSELKNSEIDKVISHFKVNKENLFIDTTQTNLVSIPVLEKVEASVGYGVTTYDETKNSVYSISMKLAHDLGVSPNMTSFIFARGNSMQPTIEGGDSLLVDLSKKEIYDGKIYCIRMDGQLYAKRLQKLSDTKLKVISDNKDYEPIILDFEKLGDYDFEVIGEIRWSGRVFR